MLFVSDIYVIVEEIRIFLMFVKYGEWDVVWEIWGEFFEFC